MILKIDGNEECVPYEKLGRIAILILSILTVTEENVKDHRQLVADTKKIALSHLRGEEWCENVSGIAAYDALIGFICDKLNSDTAWNLEYYLGTYAALKRYAWKFFEKYGEQSLTTIYREVYEAWQFAFECKCSCDVKEGCIKEKLIGYLETAKTAERQAIEML